MISPFVEESEWILTLNNNNKNQQAQVFAHIRRLRLRHTRIVATLALMLWVGTGCSPAQPTPSTRPATHTALPGVMDPAELARRLSNSTTDRLIVLDVRDAAGYESGHIAGAIRVDPTAWKNESLAGDTGLDHDTFWHQRIGGLGVSGREPVVVYDDGRMTEAARLWFIFQHFGVGEVAVVNGGYRALAPLIESGKIPVSREITAPKAVTFQPASGIGEPITLIERKRLLEKIRSRQAQIFDARTPAEFSGQDLRTNARGGHLPSAINLPHTRLMDKEGRLLSAEQLADLFRESGFQRGQPIVTHCDGGGRASLAALAAQTAGYGPVMNYYLSFGDWAADSTCPVEKSTSQPASAASP